MGIFGGSKKTTIPASGFYALPQDYRNLYYSMLNETRNVLLGDNDTLQTDLFTPLPQTDYETTALQDIQAGFTPTEESLRGDISMLMNPFDEYVIQDINRQAQGDYSILNQALEQAGQMGSNRSMLGASDIEQRRLGQIGRFRQDQYNRAIQDALTTLPNSRRSDTTARFNAGTFLRDLDTATKQAPLSALNALQGAVVSTPTSFGDFGAPQQTIKTGGGGLGGFLGSIAPIVGTAIGGPIGGAIGGAIGSAASGGGLGGALQGGLSGYLGGGGSFGNIGGAGARFGTGGFFNSNYLPVGYAPIPQIKPF